ncbi:hypothetical protein AGROH133_14524 (plasmid) [Agrobacterium tumefaciens]|nr:hypothetical protein AGROH133_14524 [Agrobacterium tumefaciens]
MWSFATNCNSELSLSWTEVGGPSVQEPTRQGYGTRYVRSALGSLFATVPEIIFAPGGFRLSVSGSLTCVIARQQFPRSVNHGLKSPLHNTLRDKTVLFGSICLSARSSGSHIKKRHMRERQLQRV